MAALLIAWACWSIWGTPRAERGTNETQRQQATVTPDMEVRLKAHAWELCCQIVELEDRVRLLKHGGKGLSRGELAMAARRLYMRTAMFSSGDALVKVGVDLEKKREELRIESTGPL